MKKPDRYLLIQTIRTTVAVVRRPVFDRLPSNDRLALFQE
ncbi:hypothetical protein PSOLE_10030 [Pseudomonas oleovorans subsp. oleovorans]|jgi:hypothetical protein|uniref:Uncharacterized protein n=1 Tax=Ectopseudomonas oleovorans TaxID=301 RepID=A0A379JNY4_ECTOL|nr:hypothetical protein Q058_00467 [Pseudomonas aeruginosa BL04]OWK48323.1 hypothetical protein PSOLE_10030 [Pseudomonas oleovorans subsp. oleovorans]SEJ16602.1 hypothetical protein SAMN05216280_101349 [Pseudomonas oleovorans]SUD50140.1 Uncharacterised protein [Pseudomonas oleovorans]